MATTETGVVLASVGYFLTVSLLLGLSGIAGETIQLPGGVNEQEGNVDQSFTTAVIECIFTLFGDCSQRTESQTFKSITDALGFAGSYVGFFFQLLTFQLPIPFLLNAFIVLPPAGALAYVGIRLIRGGG